MEPVTVSINCMAGVGKTAMVLDTSVLLGLVNRAMGARKRVFISHGFDDLVDGKQRLLAILDGLDQNANAGESASVVLFGDPDQLVPWLLLHEIAHCGFVALSRAEVRRLRSIIRSAVRETDSAVEVFLSAAERPDHPVTDFLIERRWFLLHSCHPPRPFLTIGSNWLGRVCFPLVPAK